MTFVSEDVARRTAEANKTNPVSVYVPDLVTRAQLDEAVKKYETRLSQLRALPSEVDRKAFMRGDESDDEDEDEE